MEQEEVIRMALEAGFDKWEPHCLSGESDTDRTLAVCEYAIGESVFKLASLVAAAERERCAKAAEYVSPRHTECGNKIAAAIRALP